MSACLSLFSHKKKLSLGEVTFKKENPPFHYSLKIKDRIDQPHCLCVTVTRFRENIQNITPVIIEINLGNKHCKEAVIEALMSGQHEKGFHLLSKHNQEFKAIVRDLVDEKGWHFKIKGETELHREHINFSDGFKKELGAKRKLMGTLFCRGQKIERNETPQCAFKK